MNHKQSGKENILQDSCRWILLRKKRAIQKLKKAIQNNRRRKTKPNKEFPFYSDVRKEETKKKKYKKEH